MEMCANLVSKSSVFVTLSLSGLVREKNYNLVGCRLSQIAFTTLAFHVPHINLSTSYFLPLSNILQVAWAQLGWGGLIQFNLKPYIHITAIGFGSKPNQRRTTSAQQTQQHSDSQLKIIISNGMDRV